LIENARLAGFEFIDGSKIVHVPVGVVGHADVVRVEAGVFGPFLQGRHRLPGTAVVTVADAGGCQGRVQKGRSPGKELHVSHLKLAEGNVEVQIGPFPFQVFLRFGSSSANATRSLGPGLGLTGAPGPGLIAPALLQGVEPRNELQTFHYLKFRLQTKPLAVKGIGAPPGVIGPGGRPRRLVLVQ